MVFDEVTLEECLPPALPASLLTDHFLVKACCHFDNFTISVAQGNDFYSSERVCDPPPPPPPTLLCLKITEFLA